MAAIANTQTYENVGNGATQTLTSYTPAAGSDRVLVVRVHGLRTSESGAFTVDSVTFGGVALTQAVTASTNSNSRTYRIAIWYLVNPSSSAGNVVVTFSHSSNSTIISAATMTGLTAPAAETDTDTTVPEVVLSVENTGGMVICALTSHCNGNPSWYTDTLETEYEILTAAGTSTEISGYGGWSTGAGYFGSFYLNQSQTNPQVAALARFPAAAAAQNVAPAGKGLAPGKGTATVGRGAVFVAPSGLAAALGKGTAIVGRGVVEITPSGLAVAVGLGATTVAQSGVSIRPDGLAVSTAFGTAAVARGAVSMAPAGGAAALGQGEATLGLVLSPAGLAVVVAGGTAKLSQTIAPAGLAVALGQGGAAVMRAGETIAPAGLAVALGQGEAAVGRGAVGIAPAGKAVAVGKGATRVWNHRLVLEINDDAIEDSAGPVLLSTTSMNVKLGSPWAAFRILDVDMPGGVTVQDAHMDLWPITYDDPRLVARCELSAAPAALTATHGNISGRTLTNEFAVWEATNIGTTGHRSSANFAPAVKTVSDLPEWQAAVSDLLVVFQDNGTGGWLRCYSDDAAVEFRPRLVLEWAFGPVTQTVAPPGAAFYAASGDAAVAPGAAAVAPAGLAAGVETGAVAVAVGGQYVAPLGLAAGAGFGDAAVAPGAAAVAPAGLAAGVETGNVTVLPGLRVLPEGLAVAFAPGAAAVGRGAALVAPEGLAVAFAPGAASTGLRVAVAGAAVTAAGGETSVSRGAVVITPAGLAAGVGAGTVVVGAVIAPAGLAAGVGLGVPIAGRGTVVIAPAGRTIGLAPGSAAVAIDGQYVRPKGLAAAALFGLAMVALVRRPRPLRLAARDNVLSVAGRDNGLSVEERDNRLTTRGRV